MHYRLTRADSVDGQDALEVDATSPEGALLDFGRQLGAKLSLNGDAAPDYLLQSRPGDQAQFNPAITEIYLVRI